MENRLGTALFDEIVERGENQPVFQSRDCEEDFSNKLMKHSNKRLTIRKRLAIMNFYHGEPFL